MNFSLMNINPAEHPNLERRKSRDDTVARRGSKDYSRSGSRDFSRRESRDDSRWRSWDHGRRILRHEIKDMDIGFTTMAMNTHAPR